MWNRSVILWFTTERLHSALFYLFYSILYILLYSILFYSILFYPIPLFHYLAFKNMLVITSWADIIASGSYSVVWKTTECDYFFTFLADGGPKISGLSQARDEVELNKLLPSAKSPLDNPDNTHHYWQLGVITTGTISHDTQLHYHLKILFVVCYNVLLFSFASWMFLIFLNRL